MDKSTVSKPEKRFFQRLLAFNLLVVLLATSIPLAVYYGYVHTYFNEQINLLNRQAVRQLQTDLDESVLKEVVNLPNRYLSDLSSNDALTYPMTHNIRGDSLAILKVSETIKDIRNTMTEIDSIDLYYPKSNLVFLNDSVCFIGESECKVGDPSWLAGIDRSDSYVDWIAATRSDGISSKNVETYVRSLPFFASKEQRAVVVGVSLDHNMLSQKLQEMNSFLNGNLLLLDDQGRIVADNRQEDTVFNRADLEKMASRILNMGEEGIFSGDLSGQSIQVSFVKSEYNDWRYVSVVPLGDFYKKTNDLKNILLNLILVFLLLNVTISFILTRRAQKPIANEIGDLRDRLEENWPVIRHNFIEGLLSGSINDETILAQNGRMLGIRLDKNYFFCFVLSIGETDSISFEQSLLLSYQLIDVIDNANNGYECGTIRDQLGRLSGIVFFDNEKDENQIARLLLACIHEQTDLGFLLAVGQTYTTTGNTYRSSYTEACEALKYSFLQTNRNLFSYRELGIDQLKLTGSSVKVLDEIREAIRTGNGMQCRAAVDDVLTEITTGQYKIEYCRNILMDVVSCIRNSVKELGFSSSELFGCDIREYYKSVSNVSKFKAWIYDIIDIAIGSVNKKKQNIDKDLEQKIRKYIEDNLFHQISLDGLADYVSLNRNYLSKLFKVLMGVTFSDYVIDLRMVEAEKMLRDGKLNVQEISSKLGYSSTHHFIRMFRNKYGHTPKQFQKLH